jgi:hypothetical protein
MENTRPTPTDLSQFQPGTVREDILAKIGAPIDSVPHKDGTSCDLHRLYTHGYGEGGKIPISVAETAADFFTIGLAELVLTRPRQPPRMIFAPWIFATRIRSW